MARAWHPHITTGTHDSSGRTRLHKLLANREIEEGDYLIEYDDENYQEMDDQELDEIKRGASALYIDVDWDDIGLRVNAIDWDEYPARLQHPSEQGFLDEVNEMVWVDVEDCITYSDEDDDDQDVFENAIGRLPDIDDMTPAALRIAIQEAVDAAWEAKRIARRNERIARMREIYNAGDDNGTISAAAMVDLFPGEPSRHCEASMEQAAKWCGINVESVTEALRL